MARNPDSPQFRRTYLKEWRKHRALTQAQVVARLEIMDDDQLPATEASLSRYENGKQPYNQRILEALADIYDTEPGHLITRDPTKEGEVVDFVSRLSEQEQRQVLAIARAIRDGTGG
jgi:transcriptional regulator with XRE-family HTH domain